MTRTIALSFFATWLLTSALAASALEPAAEIPPVETSWSRWFDRTYEISGEIDYFSPQAASYDIVYGKGNPRLGAGIAVRSRNEQLRLGGRLDYYEATGQVVAFPGAGTGWRRTDIDAQMRLSRLVAVVEYEPWPRLRFTPYTIYRTGLAYFTEKSGDLRTATPGLSLDIGIGFRYRVRNEWDLRLETTYATNPGLIGDAGVSAFCGDDAFDGFGVGLALVHRAYRKRSWFR